MNTTPNTLALLIDGDNAQLQYTKQMIQFCERYGTVKIKNAYGDWNQANLSPHRKTIAKLGVSPIQQNRVGGNATDIGLAMDVASMLEKGVASTYVIVSSDNDFATMCERIHRSSAQVFVIAGKKGDSKKLQEFCDQFFTIEEIVKNQSKPSTKPAVSPKPKARPTSESPKKSSPAPQPETTTMLDILIEAYQKTPRRDGGALLPQIRAVLTQIDKQFEKRFAGKRLSTWFKSFPDKFEVTGDLVRMK